MEIFMVNGSQYLNSLLGEAFASGDFSDVLQPPAIDPDKPKAWETWIIGLAIVTVSAISAPLGMLMIPCLSKSLYDRFMTFLIALGIGAMSGSVMFILIPSAFTLTTLPNVNYVTKCWLIIGALYAFFTVDRCLQFFLEFKRRRSNKRKIHASTLSSVFDETKEHKKLKEKKRKKKLFSLKKSLPRVNENDVDIEKEKDELKNDLEVQMITNNLMRTLSKRRRVCIVRSNSIDEIKYQTVSGKFIDMETLNDHRKDSEDTDSTTSSSMASLSTVPASTQDITNYHTKVIPTISIDMDPTAPKEADPELGVTVDIVERQVIPATSSIEIANVAYMILFGSSANNFVDGMSTGAAFSDSLAKGISIGLAVVSQQFPQELGTLAILINSGLGIKRALLLNIVPMILSYAGFCVGVLLGNVNEGYDEYIYSISSGMYLYIFLGTLLPEIRDSINDLLKENLPEAILTTVLQFSGIAFGLGFMFFMSIFGEDGSEASSSLPPITR
uniref:Uncharacterized protein n=1 Tax=Panagrolaimus sp. ES5 TaxID=591445 RepID=A0AC34GWG9_9BILA